MLTSVEIRVMTPHTDATLWPSDIASRQGDHHPCGRYDGFDERGKARPLIAADLSALPVDAATVDSKVALIQALIPLGLLHVEASLQQELELLTGPRYARDGGQPGLVRYGRQAGSVYLADQKLPIQVPRVRDRRQNQEVPLATYQRLQQPRGADEGVLRRILAGLSCREYVRCAEAVPDAFGSRPRRCRGGTSRRVRRSSRR